MCRGLIKRWFLNGGLLTLAVFWRKILVGKVLHDIVRDGTFNRCEGIFKIIYEVLYWTEIKMCAKNTEGVASDLAHVLKQKGGWNYATGIARRWLLELTLYWINKGSRKE